MAYEFYAGLIGGALVLLAFLLTSFNKLHRHTYRYMAVNGTGAAFLVYYGWVTNAIVFVVLNLIWVSVEIYYFVRKLFGK